MVDCDGVPGRRGHRARPGDPGRDRRRGELGRICAGDADRRDSTRRWPACRSTSTCRVPGFDADDAARQAARPGGWTGTSQFGARGRAGGDRRRRARPAGRGTGARVGVVIGTALGGIGDLRAAAQHDAGCRRARARCPPLLIPMMGVPTWWPGTSRSTAAPGAEPGHHHRLRVRRDRHRHRPGPAARRRCDVVIAGGAEAVLSPTDRGRRSPGWARCPGGATIRRPRPARSTRTGTGSSPPRAPESWCWNGMEHARARGARVRGAVQRLRRVRRRPPHDRARPGRRRYGVRRSAPRWPTPGVGPDDVDHVNAHGTSTPLNDAVEAEVLRRVLGERAGGHLDEGRRRATRSARRARSRRRARC